MKTYSLGSRKANRAGKRIGEELEQYCTRFFLFREKQENRESQAVKDYMLELDKKWKAYAMRWRLDGFQMKKSDQVCPKPKSFMKMVKSMRKKIRKDEKRAKRLKEGKKWWMIW